MIDFSTTSPEYHGELKRQLVARYAVPCGERIDRSEMAER
jgi:hypothetical protein